MKKAALLVVLFASLFFTSCGGHSETPVSVKDSMVSGGPDSAANNGIIPPSAAPGNAGNSSLADTNYHAMDSLKIKK